MNKKLEKGKAFRSWIADSLQLAGRIFAFILCAVALHCSAGSSSLNVESLINENKWRDASRAIFLEARSANRFEWSVPARQAEAGFLEDALDTIAGMHLNVQPEALLSIALDTPSLLQEKKRELVRQALEMTRRMLEKSAYLKSGDMARVALFYSQDGAEENSQAIFEEALKIAERGADEDGSGGYRQVTGAMIRESTSVRDWMISLVERRLRRAKKATDAAFAYRDLAQIALQLQRNELALELVDQGVSAARSIKESSMQRWALESLARVAMDAGSTKRLPLPSDMLAIREARLGKPQRAHAIVSELSETMYVSHRLEAYKKVFNDAVKRDDLKTALYFAERPLTNIGWVDGDIWCKVAELQAKRGMREDASSSYRRAALANSRDSIRSFEQVKVAVALTESMRQGKFESEGNTGILGALAMADLISERRSEQRIKASILLSDVLWRSGMHSEATQQILRAYRTASEFSDQGGWEKARLLAEIGKTTSTFIAKPANPR